MDLGAAAAVAVAGVPAAGIAKNKLLLVPLRGLVQRGRAFMFGTLTMSDPRSIPLFRDVPQSGAALQ